MRIAVQLYGHLRSFRDCAPAFEKLFRSRHDADVFMHTWSTLDSRTESWWSFSWAPASDVVVDEAVREEVKTLYRPLRLEVESQPPPAYEGRFNDGGSSLAGLHYMLQSMKRVNEVRRAYQREKGADYDLVVMTRPDVLLHAAVDLRDFAHEFERHRRSSVHLCLRHGVRLVAGRVYLKSFNVEPFYFGPPDVVDEIVMAADMFDERFVAYAKALPSAIVWPEEAFMEHILRQGIAPRVYLHYYSLHRRDPTAKGITFKPVPSEKLVWRPSGWRQRAAAWVWSRMPKQVRAWVEGLVETKRALEERRELAEGMAGSPAEKGVAEV